MNKENFQYVHTHINSTSLQLCHQPIDTQFTLNSCLYPLILFFNIKSSAAFPKLFLPLKFSFSTPSFSYQSLVSFDFSLAVSPICLLWGATCITTVVLNTPSHYTISYSWWIWIISEWYLSNTNNAVLFWTFSTLKIVLN